MASSPTDSSSQTATASNSKSPEKPATAMNAYPSWSPRFWHGMRVPIWWRMLSRNRFRVGFTRLPIAIGVSTFTLANDVLAGVQALIHGRKIDTTPIAECPVFILGHWRSGTTFLHELLVQDPQFASPNTFQCFAPSHFLLSEALMVRFGNFLIPKKRPMDNMEAGWKLPQEDEFALMNLGVPSPYSRIAFPQSEPNHLNYLTLEDLAESKLESWQDAFMWFLKCLTYHNEGKRLVLKSPTHTGRLGQLVKMFPKAKFIHLSRSPNKVFPSTIRLWKSLDQVQALQSPLAEEKMRAYVGECFVKMYEGYNAASSNLPSSQLIEIRYEDLVDDPMETVRSLYGHLELGDFSEIEEQLTQRLAGHENYQTNRHELPEETQQAIAKYCSPYAEQFGYEI